jgi:hypothetical protein
MQKYYKLLTQEMTSHNNTKWETGVSVTVTKQGNEMCSDQVLHCYNHLLLAAIFNPIHANIKNPRLFEIEVDEICNTDGLKFASKSQTLIKEISLPEIYPKQRADFAIKVAKLVYKDASWNLWADRWLDGSDCSDAAYAAAAVAANTTGAYAYAANTAAAYAAYAVATADSFAAALSIEAAAYAADDKEEFNRKIINIVEEIIGQTL